MHQPNNHIGIGRQSLVCFYKRLLFVKGFKKAYIWLQILNYP